MSASPPSQPDILAGLRAAQSAATDEWRRMQARTLDLFGFGVRECEYVVVATGAHWRLRRYDGHRGGVPLLLVPAPIKRPYIWDLTPSVSAIRYCLDRGFSVDLLEWLPPTDGDGGIEDYTLAIAMAAERIAEERGGTVPFVLGHSLGGTLAAMACAMAPDLWRGLVLLGAPLSFATGSSAFRDLVATNGQVASTAGTIAGSQLSQFCALIAPGSFVWQRMIDAFLSFTDPAAFDIHVRIERWALDEVPLSARLVHEIVEQLYRQNLFELGALTLSGRALGPQDISSPALAVVNEVDEIGPRAAVEPFLARMSRGEHEILAHPPEVGVGMQHLAILAGSRARAETWPQVADWILARA